MLAKQVLDLAAGRADSQKLPYSRAFRKYILWWGLGEASGRHPLSGTVGAPPNKGGYLLHWTLCKKNCQPLQTGSSGAYPCLGLDISFMALRARSLHKLSASGLYAKGLGHFQVVEVGTSPILV